MHNAIRLFAALCLLSAVVALSQIASQDMSANPEEMTQDIVTETLEKISVIPRVTEENMRKRIRLYIGAKQVAGSEHLPVAWRNITEAQAGQISEIEKRATWDAQRLYGFYIGRAAGSSGILMSENEETFYWLSEAVAHLGVECQQIYGDRNCTASTLRARAEHDADFMIRGRGGLLEQMRANRNSYEAAQAIHRLLTRWPSLNTVVIKDMTTTEFGLIATVR